MTGLLLLSFDRPIMTSASISNLRVRVDECHSDGVAREPHVASNHARLTDAKYFITMQRLQLPRPTKSVTVLSRKSRRIKAKEFQSRLIRGAREWGDHGATARKANPSESANDQVP